MLQRYNTIPESVPIVPRVDTHNLNRIYNKRRNMSRMSLKLNRIKWQPILSELRTCANLPIFENDTDIIEKAIFHYWFIHCNKIDSDLTMSKMLGRCMDSHNIIPMDIYVFFENSYRKFKKKGRLPQDFQDTP